MKNWSIDNKLWLCVLIPTLLSSLCFMGLFIQSFYQHVDQGFVRRAELYNDNLQTDLKTLLNGATEKSLRAAIETKIGNENSLLSLIIYDANKKTLYQYGQSSTDGATDREVLDRLQSKGKQSLHGNESSHFYQAIMDPSNNLVRGWLVVEWDRRSLQLQKYRLTLKLSFIAVVGFILAVLVFTFLKRSIVRPLSLLRDNLEHLSYGEIEKLKPADNGQPFDILSNYIHHAGELIKSSRQELQDTVEQATADLRESLETVEVQNVELNMARKQALAANKAKSEFLSNTSHEIRTPINGILGFVQLLLKSPLDNQQQEYLRKIEQSSHGLLTAINGIIDVSKIENGQLVLDYNPFDLREVVEASIDIFRSVAEEKQLNLRFVIASAVPRSLMGDPLRLKQILCNLISNAIKFSSQGDIVVKVSRANPNRNHSANNVPTSNFLSVNRENKIELLFTVEDQGKGIEHSAQQGLFQLFSQVDSSNSREQGGTGLGLAVSKGLVELMHGKIGVESKLDHGSTFWFKVTLGVNHNTSMSTHSDSRSIGQRSEFPAKILAVDDTPANLQLMGEFLRDLGVDVSLASSGEEALNLCKQQEFDLIFMDIQMPVIDGLETTRRIRQLEVPPNRIPIVALTAHAMTDQKTDLLLAGLDDYLSKPISENQLLHVIKRWVGNKPASAVPATKDINKSPEKSVVEAPKVNNSMPVNIQLSLKLSNNKSDLARDMLALLLKDLPDQRQMIIDLQQSNDLSALAEIVHKVRGGASYCGVPKLKETSSVADEQLRHQQLDLTSISALIESMEELIVWSQEFDIDVLFDLEPATQ